MNVPDPRVFGGSDVVVRNGSPSRLRLVYHGTMAHRLGVDLLVQAVARLRKEVPGVLLHLWGNGDDLPAFRALAKDLRVEDRVVFSPTGYPLHELEGRLSQMDVGVIGNRRGAAGDLMLPVKLLEYVWLGIPAVAPRLRTIQHYFTDDMVSYYEPEDVDSLAAAIKRLHEHAAIRCQQAQHARAFLTRHSWQHQGQELVMMYRALLEDAQ
jgi:glycosyltransferase involved in cell wall biosynthesis